MIPPGRVQAVKFSRAQMCRLSDYRSGSRTATLAGIAPRATASALGFGCAPYRVAIHGEGRSHRAVPAVFAARRHGTARPVGERHRRNDAVAGGSTQDFRTLQPAREWSHAEANNTLLARGPPAGRADDMRHPGRPRPYRRRATSLIQVERRQRVSPSWRLWVIEQSQRSEPALLRRTPRLRPDSGCHRGDPSRHRARGPRRGRHCRRAAPR